MNEVETPRTGVVQVKLTSGEIALVDAADAERVLTRRWCPRRFGDRCYAVNRSNGKTIRLHRFILGLSQPEPYIDHINGNGLDNRRANLRFATNSQNHQNARKQRRPTTSQFKGVTRFRKKWQAQIQRAGVNHYLGVFPSELDAARAYDAAAIKHFGAFARPNFPPRVQP